jgi:GGDEF domain-containing protein
MPHYALGRLGGEEFLMLLPQTDSQTALRFSQKIRAALVDKPLFNGDEKITLSFSAGVVFVTGGCPILQFCLRLRTMHCTMRSVPDVAGL